MKWPNHIRQSATGAENEMLDALEHCNGNWKNAAAELGTTSDELRRTVAALGPRNRALGPRPIIAGNIGFPDKE